jgi:DNA polymerase III epsilon subunit-like protein
MKNNILVFDTETTGLVPKGAKYDTDYDQFPHIVEIAWWMNGVMKSHIIKPVGYEIPEEASKIHGVTTEMALEKGIDFMDAISEFTTDCSDAEKIVAHNIYFDTSIIKANIIRELGTDSLSVTVANSALDKTKRIDTMYKTMKFVGAKYENGRKGIKWPRLEELYFKLFEETFPAHSAVEDVKALVRCLPELETLKIVEFD